LKEVFSTYYPTLGL